MQIEEYLATSASWDEQVENLLKGSTSHFKDRSHPNPRWSLGKD
jgi:hypothetical protein